MNMKNLVFLENQPTAVFCKTDEKHSELTEYTWNYFVKEMKKIFHFSYRELKNFRKCKIAKLIASIPFVAGCKEPERTAIAHLCIYVAEIRGFQKYFAHLPSDDVDLFNRLAFISTFEGGNKEIIEHGMNLLALSMIEGYHKSEEEDKKSQIYNPFISGAWDYKVKKEEIRLNIQNFPLPQLDNLYNDKWNF